MEGHDFGNETAYWYDLLKDAQAKRDAVVSAGDDLWNELENLREHWERTPKAPLIEEYIARWERIQDHPSPPTGSTP